MNSTSEIQARSTGFWADRREINFWHERDPLEVKFEFEEMTSTLLQRESADQNGLTYAGSSQAGGNLRYIQLEFQAVVDNHRLYSFIVQRTTPKRWVSEDKFKWECIQAFTFWCVTLQVSRRRPDLSRACAATFSELVRQSIAAEDTAARWVRDLAPIALLQREVLDAMRAGWGFFCSREGGGTHFYLRANVLVRADYGDAPNLQETYASEAAILEVLRQFFDSETRRLLHPLRSTELAVWEYIKGRLVKLRPNLRGGGK